MSRLSEEDYFLEQSPEEPHRPIRKAIKRFFVVFILLVSLLVLAGGGYLIYVLKSVSVNPFDVGPLKGKETGRINLLILGVGDAGHDGEKLSDTIMVVSFDTIQKKVAMISIPRDLRVSIPGYGLAKINSANVYGGADLARRTVESTLGIDIPYYVTTNFSGLREAVDAVGGVDVNVTQRLYDPEYPCENNEARSCGLLILPGYQHMDGATALKYVRCRKGTCGNDFGRARRQQEVLQQLWDKAFQTNLLLRPDRLQSLTATFTRNITTNLSVNGLMKVARQWQLTNGNRKDVVLSTSPGGYLTSAGGSDLVPLGGSLDQIKALVDNIFN